MPRRKDLNNDFSGAQRTALVDLMMRYITDDVVTKVTTISFPHPGFSIWDKRRFIEEMEHFLLSNGRRRIRPVAEMEPSERGPCRVQGHETEDGVRHALVSRRSRAASLSKSGRKPFPDDA